MRMRVGLIGAALAVTVMLPAAADAQYWTPGPPRGYQQIDRRDARHYDSRAEYYRGGYEGYRGGRGEYRGRRARCDRGTGGTILGAIAGGLLGNSVAGRGDRAAGTVVGAGVGALAGRAIDRDC